MYQQQFQFFWPLTEQIPLDLDYSQCVKPSLSVSSQCVSTASISFNNSTTIKTSEIDVEKINFTLNKKPNIIKRLALNTLDISWKVK